MTADFINTAFAAFLVFARVGSMMMLLPGIAEPGVSARARLSMAILVALVLAPGLVGLFPPMPDSPVALAGLITREILIGLGFGAVMRMLLSAVAVAGQIAAMETGLSMAMAFDPTQGTQTALMTSFLNVTATAFLFATGLHLVFLAGVRGVYDLAPPGAPLMIGDFAEMGLTTFATAFRTGVQMVAPLIVFNLVFYISLGVLARLMPQVQIFFVAMPLLIMSGLAIFSIVFGAALIVWSDYARETAMGLS